LRRRWTTASGQEGRFALASLSAGYEFRKETIAGTHGNERDAPIAAVRWYIELGGFDPIAAVPEVSVWNGEVQARPQRSEYKNKVYRYPCLALGWSIGERCWTAGIKSLRATFETVFSNNVSRDSRSGADAGNEGGMQ
jgi:hypothetical protein